MSDSRTNHGNTELNQNINKLIKRYLQDRCYTEKEMAEIIGITPARFYNKLNVMSRFNLIDLKRICDELLITLDELINEALNYKD